MAVEAALFRGRGKLSQLGHLQVIASGSSGDNWAATFHGE